jgi:ABC-type multidrug transport system fused ATPase/permease subunit
LLLNGSFFTICLTVVITQLIEIVNIGHERDLVEHLLHFAPQETCSKNDATANELCSKTTGSSSLPWPSAGHILITNLEVRYRAELPPAIRDLSLEICGGEHVGIVGRTGSGKSSLLLAMARLIEPASGCVCIDSIDIGRIGLQELRPHLGVLSQDPLFFSGNLRDNLDPFTEHSDETLWNAIEDVGLSELFGSSGLSAAVLELGGNLSMGERQLLCLARAALREPRVLLVDEVAPTCSVNLCLLC